jgi:hypothetical protein
MIIDHWQSTPGEVTPGIAASSGDAVLAKPAEN